MSARTIGAALASAALIASVAGSAVTAEAAPTTRAAVPVAVSLDSHRMITMPTTVQPGVNEFNVASAKRSGFQLAQLAEGYTQDEAEADIKSGLERGKVRALKRFEAHVTLIGGVATLPDTPGSFWVDLEPGSYVALDTAGRTNAAKWVTFTATGLDTGASMPTGDSVKAVDGAHGPKWGKNPASIARKGTLTFKNRSSRNHFVVLVKMNPGATLADVKAFLETEEGRPPVDFSKSLDSAVISPGADLAFTYKLPKGTYAMLCFWPDASMGGMPHAFMGMVRTIKLR